MLAPLSMRLPESDLAVIDRAAAIQGSTRTAFVRQAAVKAAQEVIFDQTFIHMSPEAFAEFKAAIEAPAEPVPQLVRTLSKTPPWEV